MGWGTAHSPVLSRQALQASCASPGALGRKWDVQPGCVLGMGHLYEFQWLFERAGHDGGQVGVGGSFTAKGVAAVPGMVFYGGWGLETLTPPAVPG